MKAPPSIDYVATHNILLVFKEGSSPDKLEVDIDTHAIAWVSQETKSLDCTLFVEPTTTKRFLGQIGWTKGQVTETVASITVLASCDSVRGKSFSSKLAQHLIDMMHPKVAFITTEKGQLFQLV
jgi:hypothetical protein